MSSGMSSVCLQNSGVSSRNSITGEECPSSLFESCLCLKHCHTKKLQYKNRLSCVWKKKRAHQLGPEVAHTVYECLQLFPIILHTTSIDSWKQLLWRAKGKIFKWYQVIAIPIELVFRYLQVVGSSEWKLLTSQCVIRTNDQRADCYLSKIMKTVNDIGSWCSCEVSNKIGQTGRIHGLCSYKSPEGPKDAVSNRTSSQNCLKDKLEDLNQTLSSLLKQKQQKKQDGTSFALQKKETPAYEVMIASDSCMFILQNTK